MSLNAHYHEAENPRQFVRWQDLYVAAFLEKDKEQLKVRIETAEAAINARLRELGNNGGGTPHEHADLADASNGLKVLRREFQ